MQVPQLMPQGAIRFLSKVAELLIMSEVFNVVFSFVLEIPNTMVLKT
jgi:hypothetical protein